MEKIILVKMFVCNLYNLLKDALRNVNIILWQSLSPVSMIQVLQKDLGLFVSIRQSSIKVLKQILEFTVLVKEKASMKSHR